MFWGARWEWPVLRARLRQAVEPSIDSTPTRTESPAQYVLIDYENVQPTGLEWLREGPFRVKVFVGPNQSKIPVELAKVVQEMGPGSELVVIGSSGRNALDFHIVYYMGVLTAQEPGASFVVVSNDQGFDPLIEHLTSKGIEARRLSSLNRHPIVEPQVRAELDERVATAVTRLTAMKTSRPKKQKSLINMLRSVFNEKLSKQELNALFEELRRREIVKLEGSRLSYRMPSEKQPRQSTGNRQPVVEAKFRAELDEQVATAVTRLVAMKKAMPGREQTLISTLNATFQKALTQQELEALFDELCRRGIVRAEGARLSYRLPNGELGEVTNGHSVTKTAFPITVKAAAATIDAPAELIAAYERRTKEHIRRVRRCMRVMASVTPHKVDLEIRAIAHDGSKFCPSEFEPYVWLNEFHRCRRAGEPFEYPAGMEERVHEAIRHHVTTNRHHPEFFADPNDMTEVDLIEMVCDWTAMAQEFEQDGGSARGWADRVIGRRIKFNDTKRAFVYRMIDLLDRGLTDGSSSI